MKVELLGGLLDGQTFESPEQILPGETFFVHIPAALIVGLGFDPSAPPVFSKRHPKLIYRMTEDFRKGIQVAEYRAEAR